MPKILALALLLLLMLSTGCEYPGVPHPLATNDSAAIVIAPGSSSFAAPAGGVAPAASSANSAPAGRAATISLRDFELSPNEVTVKAGTIKFTLVNEGRYTHDFRVEGNGVDERAPRVGVGRTSDWESSLAPGEYKISCPLSNHADRGMTGTLKVVSE